MARTPPAKSNTFIFNLKTDPDNFAYYLDFLEVLNSPFLLMLLLSIVFLFSPFFVLFFIFIHWDRAGGCCSYAMVHVHV